MSYKIADNDQPDISNPTNRPVTLSKQFKPEVALSSNDVKDIEAEMATISKTTWNNISEDDHARLVKSVDNATNYPLVDIGFWKPINNDDNGKSSQNFINNLPNTCILQPDGHVLCLMKTTTTSDGVKMEPVLEPGHEFTKDFVRFVESNCNGEELSWWQRLLNFTGLFTKFQLKQVCQNYTDIPVQTKI